MIESWSLLKSLGHLPVSQYKNYNIKQKQNGNKNSVLKISIVITFLFTARNYLETQINVSKNWKLRIFDNIVSDAVCHFSLIAHQY